MTTGEGFTWTGTPKVGGHGLDCPCGAALVSRSGMFVCLGALEWHHQTHRWRRTDLGWEKVQEEA